MTRYGTNTPTQQQFFSHQSINKSIINQSVNEINVKAHFQTGYSDNVKCFFCDGGLCDWEGEDEPWTEHARWFPDCDFLKQVKGIEFIQKVKDIGVNGGSLVILDNKILKKPMPSTSTSGNWRSGGLSNSSFSKSLTMDQRREVRAAMSSPSVIKVCPVIFGSYSYWVLVFMTLFTYAILF